MATVAAVLACVILAVLGLLHLYWALGGKSSAAAIPESNGRPAFTPSRTATVAVALGLFAAAYLVALAGHLLGNPFGRWPRFAVWGLAVVFLARAVGDFRLVGFFKRESTSRFARLDTVLYAPLCLGLAFATGYVAYHDF